MKTETLFQPIQQQLNPYVTAWQTPEPNRFDAMLSAGELLNAMNVLYNNRQIYLIAITGIDNGVEANTFELLYHFAMGSIVLTLRVTINRTRSTIPSICSIYPYASPFERETSEMFGITFLESPDISRLFLPDDWTDGIYPLRKDAQLEGDKDDQNK